MYVFSISIMIVCISNEWEVYAFHDGGDSGAMWDMMNVKPGAFTELMHDPSLQQNL